MDKINEVKKYIKALIQKTKGRETDLMKMLLTLNRSEEDLIDECLIYFVAGGDLVGSPIALEIK